MAAKTGADLGFGAARGKRSSDLQPVGAGVAARADAAEKSKAGLAMPGGFATFAGMVTLPLGFRKMLLGVALVALAGNFSRAADAAAVVWKLDDVKKVGGLATEVLGAPKVVAGAMVFDGAKDGVFVPVNPVAGMTQFTIEILFSPAEGGPEAQRFFHLQEDGTAERRIMIETRLDGKGHWWLDTFLGGAAGGTALIEPKLVHPTNKFYWAALRYDGKTMTAFVNGAKELEATDVKFGPLGAGKVSLGVRQNKVFWFKGGIREVRFTPLALQPEKLQRAP